jgi:hypothetical protein
MKDFLLILAHMRQNVEVLAKNLEKVGQPLATDTERHEPFMMCVASLGHINALLWVLEPPTPVNPSND